MFRLILTPPRVRSADAKQSFVNCQSDDGSGDGSGDDNVNDEDDDSVDGGDGGDRRIHRFFHPRVKPQ